MENERKKLMEILWEILKIFQKNYIIIIEILWKMKKKTILLEYN